MRVYPAARRARSCDAFFAVRFFAAASLARGRTFLRMRFAMLALMLFQLRAPARRPAKATAGAEGYYVLAYVLVIDPTAVPAPQYILNRVNDGPFGYPTAY